MVLHRKVTVAKEKEMRLDVEQVRRVALVDIDSVTPWKDNPRKNDAAVPKLVKLLQVHGQMTPIVVWIKDNQIYKGNTTWKAMKKLGKKKILVMFVEFSSRSAAIAYAIADNKASEWSEWDDDVLRQLMEKGKIEELAGSPDEIEMLTGFNEKEYTSLMSGGMFASKQFIDTAAEFEDSIKKTRGLKSAWWFWFEVPDKETFDKIKKAYERGEGKRLYRELDAQKTVDALI
jgi:ParB-like chromosome segregation protein Spo0J